MEPYQNIFAHLPTLQTGRLTLRPMTMRDAQDLYLYSKDPEVARHVLWDAHTSIRQTRAYIRYMLHQYRMGAPSSYCIVCRETGHAIGTIGFMWYSSENAAAEVGYSLARPEWNKGYMTEALNAVLGLAFDVMRLNRVEAQHETDNPASGKVMQHAGMRYEGTLRDRLYNKGRYVDVSIYAILRREWRAVPAPISEWAAPTPTSDGR